MRRYLPTIILSCCLASQLLSGCSKKGDIKYYPDPVVVAIDTTPLVKLPAYWVKATALMKDFPTGIQVYRSIAPFNGKAMNAYSVIIDTKAPIEIKPVYTPVNKKLNDIYRDEPGMKYAAINGGFFGTNASYSLVMYNSIINALNIKSLSRTYNNTATTYYPTRGAFGLKADGSPDIAWVYHVGANNTLYSYPQPSPNNANTAPQPVPTATYPANAIVWNAVNAIGGSPVLIKNGQINITDTEELIVIDNSSARARSAIGYTVDGKVIILGVEGNNSAGGTGLSLPELAQLMKEMGCVAALNLDGGGSTSFIIRSQQTVKPSDGSERDIMSALIIKSK